MSSAWSGKPSLDELLERNKEVAKTHKPLFYMNQLPPEALPKIAVVACSDPRCNPDYFFGARPGELFVIRNVGGRVAPTLVDIASIDVLFSFKEIYVVHHTDCGATLITEDDVVRSAMKASLPVTGPKVVDALAPLPIITDLEQSLRDDLKLLRDSPFIRKELAESARAFLLDVTTGLLKPVA